LFECFQKFETFLFCLLTPIPFLARVCFWPSAGQVRWRPLCSLAQCAAAPRPFQPKPRAAHLLSPQRAQRATVLAQLSPTRGRPAAVADGRAPPVIPDLRSETDWGSGPDPEPDPCALTPGRRPARQCGRRPAYLKTDRAACAPQKTLAVFTRRPNPKSPAPPPIPCRAAVELRRCRLPVPVVPLRSFAVR
jgi:hypothetical protein